MRPVVALAGNRLSSSRNGRSRPGTRRRAAPSAAPLAGTRTPPSRHEQSRHLQLATRSPAVTSTTMLLLTSTPLTSVAAVGRRLLEPGDPRPAACTTLTSVRCLVQVSGARDMVGGSSRDYALTGYAPLARSPLKHGGRIWRHRLSGHGRAGCPPMGRAPLSCHIHGA